MPPETDDPSACSPLLLLYGVAFAFFCVGPALLRGYLWSPLTWGDGLDFLTPFAIASAVYLLYRRLNGPAGDARAALAKTLLVVGALLWVDGHGLHLSSNSIARLVWDMKGTGVYEGVYLFDETISHLMRDSGVLLVSLGLVLLSLDAPFGPLYGRDLASLFTGAACYGIAFAVNGIEGQSVVLTFPAAVVGFALCLALLLGRDEARQNPFVVFFAGGYLTGALLFALWGLHYSGFPQFSELYR